MRDAVITHAVRTAIGKIGGSLSSYDEQDLAARVLDELVRRAHIDAGEIDEVILGNVKMNTRPMNVARFGWLGGKRQIAPTLSVASPHGRILLD